LDHEIAYFDDCVEGRGPGQAHYLYNGNVEKETMGKLLNLKAVKGLIRRKSLVLVFLSH
jgi:hypothetical protein